VGLKSSSNRPILAMQLDSSIDHDKLSWILYWSSLDRSTSELDVFACLTTYVLESVHKTASSSASPLMVILFFWERVWVIIFDNDRSPSSYFWPNSNVSTNSGVLNSTRVYVSLLKSCANIKSFSIFCCSCWNEWKVKKKSFFLTIPKTVVGYSPIVLL
jgi:hypothetical protein